MRRGGTWRCLPPAAIAVLGLLAAAGCGHASTGEPKNLSLSGDKVPTAQVKTGVSALCAVAKQAHTDPVGANGSFYAGSPSGPHNTEHLLVAILAPSHKAQSDGMLDAMLAFEGDLTAKPPPASTGNDADALVARTADGLRALRVTPPPCG